MPGNRLAPHYDGPARVSSQFLRHLLSKPCRAAATVALMPEVRLARYEDVLASAAPRLHAQAQHSPASPIAPAFTRALLGVSRNPVVIAALPLRLEVAIVDVIERRLSAL